MPSKPALELFGKDKRALWTKNSEVEKQLRHVYNGKKPRPTQVDALSFLNMQRTLVSNFYQFLSAEKRPEHKIRKPLLLRLETQISIAEN